MIEPSEPDTDDPITSADEPLPEPPPMPAGVSPDVEYMGKITAWSARSQVVEVRRHRAETRQGFRRLGRRIGEVGQGVAALDADRDEALAFRERAAKALGRGIGAVWATVKGPLTQLALAVGAYLAWRYLQIPPTPTPLQVAPVATTAPTGYTEAP